MTGFHLMQNLHAYSGGTVRDSHPVFYSPAGLLPHPQALKRNIYLHGQYTRLTGKSQAQKRKDRRLFRCASHQARKKSHHASGIRVVRKTREAAHSGLIIGASGCALCTPCAQHLPCKFPERKSFCMSAYCILVKKLAAACEMEYDCKEGLLDLFGMCVFD